ncbi:MAG: ferrochelatase [Thermoplasmatales archaeon]|nr:ferrochelatase [Candidatus Thermoplasmatota archaeon]MCL6003405.1 ferrochelatase [Candidatus Thermoplasmatota archaeon]MDA8056347.1 ferrochelatase [Thermoplasmatales archaeon]
MSLPGRCIAIQDKAVVLMYYGFPDRREEMHDYLKDILHGKDPPEGLIRENLQKLDIVGGSTPSTKIVKSIKEKVSKRLEDEGYSVYLLSKHYTPSLNDAAKIVQGDEVYEVPLFPVYSKFIFDGYFGPLEEQLKGKKLIRVSDIGFNRGMIDFYKGKIKSDRNSLLTFSAHSIPLVGPDSYSESVLRLSREIADTRQFINIYHSQGPFRPKWLTPYPEYSVSFAKENGFKRIQIVPIGFIYEHLEVLYDLDYRLKNEAAKEGIGFDRVPLPNDGNVVIDAIVDSIYRSKS